MRAKYDFAFYQQQNQVRILCASKIHIVGSVFGLAFVHF